MKKIYTIGIMFRDDFRYVLLLEKQKPGWQKGRLNFPGGKTEELENCFDCIAREFYEETALKTEPSHWMKIGEITNPDDPYRVDIMAIKYEAGHGLAMSLTDERVGWYLVNHLPGECLSNLHWLVPFARNIYQQGNNDLLIAGSFWYRNKP